MSLRRASLVFAALLAIIATVVAIVLVDFSTRLHRTATQIGTTVESLRIAEEIELGLVSVRDASNPVEREASEDLLHRQLADAWYYVTSAREREVLTTLGQQIDAYLATLEDPAISASGTPPDARSSAAFAAAFRKVRALIEVNVEQSREIRGDAARWDELSDLIGLISILLVVLGLGSQIVWLQRRAFRPALRLVGAIERYAAGERTARAAEQGPEEFRTIAHRFNDMATTLERQRERQVAFLAGVAHDLRNPLTALKMATTLVPPDAPLPSEPRIRQLFARIDRQIGALDRMVYDLLDAARVEAGQLDLQIGDCDLCDIVHGTVDLFDAARATHQLVVEVPAEPVRAACDPGRIEQVLTNLVSNAIKYSPRGGTVRVTARQDDDGVQLSVSDEGVGMSPNELAFVFEPFQRAGTSKEAIPGVGLGLFVSRRIVEAHHGRIAVTSTPGHGSTFTVHLPRRAG